jgi:hypothetical protein
MAAKKKPRKTVVASRLVKLDRIKLTLDLSLSGLLEARASLKGALETSDGSGLAQLWLDARDLNAIYIYLSEGQMKKLVARLTALELDDEVAMKLAKIEETRR